MSLLLLSWNIIGNILQYSTIQSLNLYELNIIFWIVRHNDIDVHNSSFILVATRCQYMVKLSQSLVSLWVPLSITLERYNFLLLVKPQLAILLKRKCNKALDYCIILAIDADEAAAVCWWRTWWRGCMAYDVSSESSLCSAAIFTWNFIIIQASSL